MRRAILAGLLALTAVSSADAGLIFNRGWRRNDCCRSASWQTYEYQSADCGQPAVASPCNCGGGGMALTISGGNAGTVMLTPDQWQQFLQWRQAQGQHTTGYPPLNLPPAPQPQVR